MTMSSRVESETPARGIRLPRSARRAQLLSAAREVFVAKGRDGTTDIWGIIIRPIGFDPKKKYPVIENIYAGPQDSFVPKGFSAFYREQALAEFGVPARVVKVSRGPTVTQFGLEPGYVERAGRRALQ